MYNKNAQNITIEQTIQYQMLKKRSNYAVIKNFGRQKEKSSSVKRHILIKKKREHMMTETGPLTNELLHYTITMHIMMFFGESTHKKTV